MSLSSTNAGFFRLRSLERLGDRLTVLNPLTTHLSKSFASFKQGLDATEGLIGLQKARESGVALPQRGSARF